MRTRSFDSPVRTERTTRTKRNRKPKPISRLWEKDKPSQLPPTSDVRRSVLVKCNSDTKFSPKSIPNPRSQSQICKRQCHCTCSCFWPWHCVECIRDVGIYRGTELSGYRGAGPSGYRNVASSRNWDIGLSGHRGIWISDI